jgi:hypothetical protein
MASDVVYEDFAAENLQIHYREHQKWFFLPDQKPTEAFMFKSADSEDCVAKGKPTLPGICVANSLLTKAACPHAGFFNPSVKYGEVPRESIDLRAFVLYADLPEYPPTHNARFEA